MEKSMFMVDRERLEVTNIRVFDAPLARVWKAVTDPTIIPKWWGPRALQTTVDAMDFRVGGVWRFVQRDELGNQYAFHGKYQEIVDLTSIVQTFILEPFPDRLVIATSTFEELPGPVTRLTEVSRYQTVSDLDGMVKSGMEMGVRESMDRIDEVLCVLEDDK